MSNNKQHINHLTPQQIEDYAANRLTDEQMHLIEKHMLNCEFCEIAVEGVIESGLPFGFNDDVEILKTRVENRAQENRKKIIPFWQLGIAASILVIIGVGSFLIFGGKTQTPEIKLAEKKVETKEAPKQEVETDTTTLKIEENITDSVLVEKAIVKPHSFLVAENNALTNSYTSNSSASGNIQASYSAPAQAVFDSDVSSATSFTVTEELAMVDEPTETKEVLEIMEDEESIVVENEAQLYKITGKVLTTSGEPIPFANVLDLTDNSGTVTDFEGNFVLNSLVDSPKIKVNYLGFKTEEVLAAAEQPLNITLKEDAMALNEVQVISAKSIKNSATSLNVEADILQSLPAKKIESATPAAPAPVDGYEAFNQYIKKNTKLTVEAKANNISGVVTLSFKIDNDGKPKSIKVEKSLGYGLDEQLINLIENGPKWTTTSNERVEYGFEFK